MKPGLTPINRARLVRIRVLRRRGFTYAQIGAELGISGERVRQLAVGRRRPVENPHAVQFPVHPLIRTIIDTERRRSS